MRVAVTGAGGRLGRALVTALEEAPFTGPGGPIAWPRSAFDLDAPDGVVALLERDRVETVVHAAAWTDVDGCAREPELASRRNGEATGVLAAACAARGVDLIVVSTNEVFDGRRTDGRGYGPDDPASPPNAYGASKLAGEDAARDAFERAAGAGKGRSAPQLAIVRTAWLFGPGRPDFPAKILAAAQRALDEDRPLQVVDDEWGSPTFVADLAEGIVELLGNGTFGGTHHLVNGGVTSRAGWAADIVARAGLGVDLQEVPAATWPRASTAPAWAVLEPTPMPSDEPLRSWREAMADYAPTLLREHRRSSTARTGR
jgi:dTDP-4-dehydrorhamnose reductase